MFYVVNSKTKLVLGSPWTLIVIPLYQLNNMDFFVTFSLTAFSKCSPTSLSMPSGYNLKRCINNRYHGDNNGIMSKIKIQ